MEPLTGETLPEPTHEPVVEGTIVAEFSPAVQTAERPGFTRKLSSFLFGEQEDGAGAVPPSGPTVGSLLGFTEQVLELPPGDIGLTVNQGREKMFEVAAGSPLVAQIPRGFHLVKEHDHVALSPGKVTDPRGFHLVSVDGLLAGEDSGAGANLVARARKEQSAAPGPLSDTTRSHALLFSGLGAVYVGPDGFTTPVGAADPVIDAFGVDRTLFDAANATKARTHVCHGMPGTLRRGEMENCAQCPEYMCCVFPWTIHMLAFSPIFLSAFLYNTFRSKHRDMEFPPWGDAALILTDKGIVGRRNFGPDSPGGGCNCCCIGCGDLEGEAGVQPYWRVNKQKHENGVNAIAWSGFDVDKNVRIHTYGGGRCVPTRMTDAGDSAFDALVVGLHCGCCIPGGCCMYVCIQPDAEGLYRATIFSKHETLIESEENSHFIPTGSIELLALARSPDDLRNSLRAAQEKYGAPAAAIPGQPWSAPRGAAMKR